MIAIKFLLLLCMVAAVSCYPHHHEEEHHHEVPAHYEFKYSVHDPHTGDVKQQAESRKGHDVKGYYTLKEADGTKRIVHYTASKEHGFEAHVEHEGHPTPAPYHHHEPAKHEQVHHHEPATSSVYFKTPYYHYHH